MSQRPPVTDWKTDFDHLDKAWVEDPFPIWAELRQTCPVAHTDRFRGLYLPTRYADIREIAYDTETFSSRRIMVVETPPPVNSAAPPITSDPPNHRPARMVLLPAFTPDAVARLEPVTRAVCRELIDAVIDKGTCDGSTDFARHIPVRIMAHMLGLPDSDGEKFRGWVHDLIEASVTDPQAMKRAVDEMAVYFQAAIDQRRAAPTQDLITYLMGQQIDGQPISDTHIVGTLRLLLIAGIDTTWSAIGSSLWHLATNPADCARLVAEPALMTTAIEEFLRAYAPVTMARKVMKDREIGGTLLQAGQTTMLCFPAANRDPAVFPDPDKVVLDRKDNRHAAFGLGIHRCIGSNLARMEMRVALEEWLARIPKFRLAEGADVAWAQGPARGPRRLPFILA
jgi:cytochrome P450